jgi:hypothetical protein
LNRAPGEPPQTASLLNNNYSATGLGPNSPPIESAGQIGSSTGSILYYSETKNWLNGSSILTYGAGGFNYSQADRDYADAYPRDAGAERWL